MAEVQRFSKKRAFVNDGVFRAELHAFFSRILIDAGYAGFNLQEKKGKLDIVLLATKTREITGEKGTKIRELEVVIGKRFGLPKDGVTIQIYKIVDKSFCAAAQAESLKLKLLTQVPVRLAANSILKSIMRSNAKGCEIIISGKLKQQRAKSMKYKMGELISTGQPKNDYIDLAVRHVYFAQGMMGVKVKIMRKHDPTSIVGAKKPLPDCVKILDPPKDEDKDIRSKIVAETN
jgi:small subunit ribosomal protein S3e